MTVRSYFVRYDMTVQREGQGAVVHRRCIGVVTPIASPLEEVFLDELRRMLTEREVGKQPAALEEAAPLTGLSIDLQDVRLLCEHCPSEFC